MLLLNQTVHRLIDLALEEDIGPGDITTQTTIDPEIFAEAHIRAKEDLVVAGLPVAQAVFAHLDAGDHLCSPGGRRRAGKAQNRAG